MPKKHYLTIAAAAMLGLSSLSTALAGTETATADGKEAKAPVTPCPVTYITGDFGVTFTSEYISRGIVEADQTKGVIAQPYLDLYFKLYTGTGFIDSVSAQLSFWADVGSNHSTAASNAAARDWYEFDWDPGISVTFLTNFTLLTQYFEFDSPATVFNAARSIDANLTYNDSAWWTEPMLAAGSFSLHPHVTVLYELGGETGNGLTPGAAGIVIPNVDHHGVVKNGFTGGHGWYYELGIAPSYTFLPKATYPITLSIPATVGLGDAGMYLGNNFGYFSVGPSVSVPLAFIPSGFGSWTLTAAYTYYYEGTTVRAFDAPPLGSGANSRNVFSGAIGCTF
jgi:hypothetical protein